MAFPKNTIASLMVKEILKKLSDCDFTIDEWNSIKTEVDGKFINQMINRKVKSNLEKLLLFDPTGYFRS